MVVSYISWAPHCSRSDHTARELGGRSHMVYWGWLGSHPATVVFKYLGQSLSTWKLLLRERPDVVFVMTPPPIAIIPVYLYCLFSRARYVVDAHSGVFMTTRWRHFLRLQFWLCRHAATTIVTNEHLAALVQAHGGRTTIVPDVPIQFDTQPGRESEDFKVVCVTSFDRDEPIAAMIEAARRLPDVPFFMTGNASKADQLVRETLPKNLTLTGFLDNASYGTLIATAGVVMALTKEDHTMQRAAYEAIYQGTPVIVTDTPILRSAFDEGAAVHVDNSPEAITAAVVKIRDSRGAYQDGARRLRARKYDQWLRTKSALLEAVAAQ